MEHVVNTGSQSSGRLDRPNDGQLLEGLKLFGHSAFRESQREIISRIVAGEDVSVSLATGAGKSLLYQLPASLEHDKLTLVFSPLIALMSNQVDYLKSLGIPAAYLTALMDEDRQAEILEQAKNGKLRLLYVSPERVVRPSFLEVAPKMPISQIVVDEAHCVDAWGHDFRPTYMKIGPFRTQHFPNVPMLALTATSSPSTRERIVDKLELKSPWSHHGPANRTELNIEIESFETLRSRESRVMELVKQYAERGEPTIVYCQLITSAIRLSHAVDGLGVPHSIYHGQLDDPSHRQRQQDDFLHNTVPLIIATGAFGMGIDKRDIRNVIVTELPRSVEELWQAFGRAARDRLPANVFLACTPYDLEIQNRFHTGNNPSKLVLERHFLGLWNGTTTQEREKEVPSSRFWAPTYLKNFGPEGSERFNHAQSSLAILEQHGLIEISAGRIFFVQKPDTFKSGVFPIQEADLQERETRYLDRQKLLMHIVAHPDQARDTIVNFLERGLVPANIEDNNLNGLIIVPKIISEVVLETLKQRELPWTELSAHLRGVKDLKLPNLGSLSGFEAREVEFYLQVLIRRGDLLSKQVGSKILLTPPHNFNVEESKDLMKITDLKNAPRRTKERSMLAQVVRPWLDENVELCGSNAELWRVVMPSIFDYNFTFSDGTKLGRDILAVYCRTPPESLRIMHVLNLLRDLFPDFKIPLA